MKFRALALVPPLAAALVVLGGAAPAAAAACSVQQLTNTDDPISNTRPRISDDGTVVSWTSDGDLAFPSDNADGSPELYRFDLTSGGVPEQVTDTTSSEVLTGELSGDGDRIAFTSVGEHGDAADNGDGSQEVFLWQVGDDSSDIQQLTNTDEDSRDPAINADGTRIAFVSRGDLNPGHNADGNLDIFVRDTVAATTAQLTETTGGGGNYFPHIDSGGTRVAFTSDHDLTGAAPDGGQDVFRVNTTIDTTTLLVDAPEQGAEVVAVDADASVVAFAGEGLDLTGGNPDGSYEIYTHRAGSGVSQITDLPEDHYTNETRLDSTGDRLAFEANGDMIGENPPGEEYQLWVADRTGRVGIDQLTHGAMDVGHIDMNQDGTRLVFNSPGDPVGENADGNREIFVLTCGSPHRTYTDVPPANFFYEPVEWMAAAGVANGFPNGTFKPDDPVKRQQMANFLYNLAGQPEVIPSGQTFSDVPPSNPFFVPIEWMAGEGIANGFPGGLFKPGDPVKRQQMANFLYNLAGQPDFTPPGTPTFNDVPASNPFFTQIEWMTAEGIANGFPGGLFKPADPVKRQQMAQFLLNLVNGPGLDLD